MTVNRWSLLLAAGLLPMIAGARRAEACSDGPGCTGVYSYDPAFAIVYTALTAPFIVNDLIAKEHGKDYALTEALIHTPLAAGFAYLAWRGTDSRPSAGERVLFGGLTLLHGTLAAHGVYAMVHAHRRAARRAYATLAPALIPDGAGLGLSGTF